MWFATEGLSQVCLGRYQTQFNCDGGSISVEGRWELRDSAGALLDWRQDHEERASSRIHLVLDVAIVGYEVDPPSSFTIIFANGLRLSVFDDSEAHESFSIHIGEHQIFV